MNLPEITIAGLAKTSLLVSAVIVSFLPLRPLLRRYIGSQWVSLLWLALFLRLMAPWPLETRIGLFKHKQEQMAAPIPATPVVTTKIKITSAPAPGNKSEPPSHIPARAPVVASAPMDYSWFLSIGWTAGLLLSLVLLAWRCLQTRSLAAKSQPATDERLLRIFSSIPQPWRRNVTLRMTTAAEVPTLAGIFRPQIWMPLAWPAQFTDEELRSILLHELGHARRRDLLAQWFFAIVQSIHWFNPLVWIAARTARFDREMACDAWVLARSGGDQTGYGAVLVKTVQLLRNPGHINPGTVAMASSRRSLYTRVSNISAFQPTPSWRGALGIAAMIILLAGVTTNQSTGADASPDKAAGTNIAPAITPAPPVEVDSKPHLALQSKVVEIDEDDWKAFSETHTNFKNFTKNIRDLDRAKKSFAELADEYTRTKAAQDPTGNWDVLSSFGEKYTAGMLKDLSQAKGVNFIDIPTFTISNGKQGTAEVTRAFRYPTEYSQEKNPGTKPRPTKFETKNLGIALEIASDFDEDGSNATLKISAEISTLLGFLYTEGSKEVFVQSLDDIASKFATPIISNSRLKTELNMSQGSTVVLALSRLETLPGQAGSEPSTVRKVVLIFITPKLDRLPVGKDPGLVKQSSTTATPPPETEGSSKIPYATPVAGKPGFVTSPYSPQEGYIDVRDFPAGTEVKDPYSSKIFLVP